MARLRSLACLAALAAPLPAGDYLLVGRLSWPQVDCPALAAQLRRKSRSQRSRVGVVCALEAPGP